MAARVVPAMSSSLAFAFAFLLLLLHHHLPVSECKGADYGGYPIADGLSVSFYKSSCPEAESLVRKHLWNIFRDDIGQAAGLLRLHFHDCFVQGCDGSILLDGSASRPSEQEDAPNLTLRASAFKIIEELRELLNRHCGNVVSCADIVALAARDSVFRSGGPEYNVPLGRRDGLTFASKNVTLENLPAPTNNASFLLTFFTKKGLDATDLVALSGGHTIGRGHCSAFTNRLYPTQDPTMEESFAKNLTQICPTANTNETTMLDIRSPNEFDNKYYVNLVNREGLFTSDQDLYTYSRTRDIVKSFATDQTLYFEKFVHAILKMGQMSVLTGTKGEIRANCSVRNSDNIHLISVTKEDLVIEEDLESRAELK